MQVKDKNIIEFVTRYDWNFAKVKDIDSGEIIWRARRTGWKSMEAKEFKFVDMEAWIENTMSHKKKDYLDYRFRNM